MNLGTKPCAFIRRELAVVAVDERMPTIRKKMRDELVFIFVHELVAKASRLYGFRDACVASNW